MIIYAVMGRKFNNPKKLISKLVAPSMLLYVSFFLIRVPEISIVLNCDLHVWYYDVKLESIKQDPVIMNNVVPTFLDVVCNSKLSKTRTGDQSTFRTPLQHRKHIYWHLVRDSTGPTLEPSLLRATRSYVKWSVSILFKIPILDEIWIDLPKRVACVIIAYGLSVTCTTTSNLSM